MLLRLRRRGLLRGEGRPGSGQSAGQGQEVLRGRLRQVTPTNCPISLTLKNELRPFGDSKWPFFFRFAILFNLNYH